MKKMIIIAIIIIAILSVAKQGNCKENGIYIGFGICTSTYPGYTLELNEIGFPVITKLFMERTAKITFLDSLGYPIKKNTEDRFGIILLPKLFGDKNWFHFAPGIGLGMQPQKKFDKELMDYKDEYKPDFQFVYGGQIVLGSKRAEFTIGYFNTLDVNIGILIRF